MVTNGKEFVQRYKRLQAEFCGATHGVRTKDIKMVKIHHLHPFGDQNFKDCGGDGRRGQMIEMVIEHGVVKHRMLALRFQTKPATIRLGAGGDKNYIDAKRE